jgi:RimJ/RimL family protein N-acetyltransferase
MVSEGNPVVVDAPMPIRTPRLLIRPRQLDDAAASVAAVRETWDDLHRWMTWAETLDDNTIERQEARARSMTRKFLRREEFNLIGLDVSTGEPVIWCGIHDIDWQAHTCETGFWVRKSAHGRGFATESTNALLRYAFGALGMRRVGITHSAGNEASRRVVQKLGFTPEGVLPRANPLPGGRAADRHVYTRLDTAGLPPLAVTWG